MKEVLELLRSKLTARIAIRRKVLTHDACAGALEDLVKALDETIAETKPAPRGDLIDSHLSAHTDDAQPRIIERGPPHLPLSPADPDPMRVASGQ